MTKIDIFSGFLGAGKTTLIKKLIKEAFTGEQLVLIENEFGEIAIDGGFLQDAGIKIREMSQGCICCSLVGDFGKALRQVMEQYHPDRILIEPSGVGKLSDVIRAVQNLGMEDVELNSFTTVADATKCKLYAKNFGEFYNDQISHANCIVLSRTSTISQEKLDDAVDLMRKQNQIATIITTPWDKITGAQILEAMEHKSTLTDELAALASETARLHEEEEEAEDEHDHDHEDHDHEDHDHEDHDHEEHEHHHHHHHHHDGDHDADEIFESWGIETSHKFTKETIENDLKALDDAQKYGLVLRAKGIVEAEDGSWIHFDYVPGEVDVRSGSAIVMGRLCVIGSELKQDALKELFD